MENNKKNNEKQEKNQGFSIKNKEIQQFLRKIS